MSLGLTPVTRDEQFAAAPSGDLDPTDLPKAETNVEKYLKYAAEHGGEGGFTPTDAQLDAMNSGIDSTKVAQIQTNKNSIDGQQNATSSGGNGYALINNIRLYVASSAPTGNIPDGSVGVGW